MRTAQVIKDQEARDVIVLPDEWQPFLGPVSHPFKMLVWGLPGSGKSTFMLRLLDVLNQTTPTLYISAEESLNSDTLQRRLARTMEHAKQTLIIERMPETVEHWHKVILCEEPTDVRRVIAIDSLTALGMSPFEYAAGLEFLQKQEGLSWGDQLLLYGLLTSVSQVWIAQAQKDGRAYRGEGNWAHEADIVVKCEDGIAQ